MPGQARDGGSAARIAKPIIEKPADPSHHKPNVPVADMHRGCSINWRSRRQGNKAKERPDTEA
jgi:hypothetical protein